MECPPGPRARTSWPPLNFAGRTGETTSRAATKPEGQAKNCRQTVAAAAVPGQQLLNGFKLAVKNLNGKLGGLPTEIVVVDDELKPDVAVTKVKALIDRDKATFVVGPIFSNILAAIMKPTTEAGAILISPNAGTSSFAGKDCNPNFFVTSYQNDQIHEISGQYAQEEGFKTALIIVPNYQAGKDAAAGFKHKFGGEIADEIYVPLGQLDYSAELSRISSANPKAIYAFLPGGMGINFVKQFRQAGLADRITFLSAFTVTNPRFRHFKTRRWVCSRVQTGRQPQYSAKQGLRGTIREGL